MIRRSFSHVMGRDSQNCVFLAQRWSDLTGGSDDMNEGWVGQVVDGRVHTLMGKIGWLADLWVSPSGRIFVAEATSGAFAIHWNLSTDPTQTDWQTMKCPAVIEGVWGLHDELVFAWGRRGSDNDMYWFNGQSWSQMPSPGVVVAMHGTAPDCIFAVGEGGMVAHWNGAQWRRTTVPSVGTLSAVHVVSPDEVYATGPARRVLEGSIYGWQELCSTESGGIYCGKWRDDLWVVTGVAGLSRVIDNELVPVMHDPLLRPYCMHLGERMLLATADAIYDSADGETFQSLSIDLFRDAIQAVPPMWKK